MFFFFHNEEGLTLSLWRMGVRGCPFRFVNNLPGNGDFVFRPPERGGGGCNVGLPLKVDVDVLHKDVIWWAGAHSKHNLSCLLCLLYAPAHQRKFFVCDHLLGD